MEWLFPSLTGVIRFLIAKKQYKKISTDKFPSLTGVIRFLISHQTICENLNSIDLVSVPYRGYSFFNLIGKSENGKSIVLKFPSLTGVIRFLILPSKTRMATGLKMRFAGQNYF